MEIVKMNELHVGFVAELERKCFSLPWSVTAIAGELENPLSLWLVAEHNGKVVGYIGSQSVMGEADMMNLAVAPEFRRKGIGEALVNALVEALRAQQVYCLLLEVRVSNETAIALYRKLGFEQVGRRPGYYQNPREDALILRKEWAL